jgi:hypothetical protein
VRASRYGALVLWVALALAIVLAVRLDARRPGLARDVERSGTATSASGDRGDTSSRSPATIADSVASDSAAAAERADTMRVVVSLARRRLWVLHGADTALSAPIGVAMGTSLDYGGRVWTFKYPRGSRVVLGKQANPVWVPPDWHYAEVAHDYGLQLDSVPRDHPVFLRDGSRLEVRHGEVGIIYPSPDTTFLPLPTGEEIVFDSTLYIPPYGTKNRAVVGELGRYRLDVGNGYMLHGTPDTASIGEASTHGCVRLRDKDITWLYKNVPIGTPVDFRW